MAAMKNMLVDRRDQDFVLYEMLNIEESLCTQGKYDGFTRDVFDMTLDVAHRVARDEIYPTLQKGDREGCSLINGEVHVPECFHPLQKVFCEGGWGTICVPVESGGMGFPHTVYIPVVESFIHNFAFTAYNYLTVCAANLIDRYGTEDQKGKYRDRMYSGQWGGTMALTEPESGSDVGSLKTRAVRQPDGTYRIFGAKIFITGADSDLFENIINPVLARIEGDPAGTKGISIFLVPKYPVNKDGTLGPRNDYTVTGLEHKMGIRGSATCAVSFGDNNGCYGEILGQERMGMKIMFQMMNEARIGVGLQGLGGSSAAYLHALSYARERIQGVNIMQIFNPDAARVSIIEHPDVRRMLLWMKSHVEGMRALVYFCGFCLDMSEIEEDDTAKEKWKGLLEILTPVCKAFCTDTGFKVTEQAIQVYGGAGYCRDYPVEQLMRDMKIASIYEGTNGIQALDLVGRKLGMKDGEYFKVLIDKIKGTLECYKTREIKTDMAACLETAVKTLEDTAAFMGESARAGKFMAPVSNAVPFLNLMGTVCLGWLLFWQAGIAAKKTASYMTKIKDSQESGDLEALCTEDANLAFYTGKIYGARYYIMNVLPMGEAYAKAIRSGDLSVTDIPEICF